MLKNVFLKLISFFLFLCVSNSFFFQQENPNVMFRRSGFMEKYQLYESEAHCKCPDKQ